MQNLVFLFLVFFVGFVSEAPAAPKTLQESLDGKWQGFCTPIAAANTSRQCNYSFQKAGTGVYQCDYYKDLRCTSTSKDSKTTSAPFRFTVSGGTEKTGKVNIEFIDRDDVRQEKSRFYITGEVLRVQVYEVLRMPEIKEENLEGQGVIPFFEFTKTKAP
jgi:hypothetical protein